MIIIRTCAIIALIGVFFSINSFAGTQQVFENMNYFDKIQIKTLIIRKSEICEIFKGNNLSQLNYEQLWGEDIYLVIQIKNKGNLTPWGKLSCKINDRDPIKVEIQLLKRNMSNFDNYLIPVIGILPPTGKIIPKIEVKWEELYTY